MNEQLVYTSWMIAKNVFLFGAGCTLGIIMFSLVLAYYFHQVGSINVSAKNSNISFVVDEETRLLHWNRPNTFSESIEALYKLVWWHFTGAKSTVMKRSEKCVRCIFIMTLIVLIVFSILGVWLSFDIQHLMAI